MIDLNWFNVIWNLDLVNSSINCHKNMNKILQLKQFYLKSHITYHKSHYQKLSVVFSLKFFPNC